ncbi:MAG: tryptophan--tRNA ligase, partial [Parcubacteria group bacterium]|nr:tryptophan--tRNA ligase [Parcubacteria group bacterium]
GYKEFKESLAELLIKKLKPFRELEAKPEYINDILKQGAEKAQIIATETMQKVKKSMGLI